MIEWEKIPRFEIVGDDDTWNTFICISSGRASFEGIEIIFEEGWITDIASVPWWARSFIPQIGPHSPAALVHDKLLNMGIKREIARQAMVSQLERSPKVNNFQKWLMETMVAIYDLYVKIRYDQD